MKFRVGDELVYITREYDEPISACNLEIGKVYKVLRVDPVWRCGRHTYQCVDVGGADGRAGMWWHDQRAFELAVPRQPFCVGSLA
jgi:hypothetical protein